MSGSDAGAAAGPRGWAERLSLAGRTALVTGASRGIGAAVARRLDEAGARVALSSRDDAAHMAERGGGSIVTVSSVLSGSGTPYGSLYAASKGALDAATRALAAEWGPAGVRVNAVRPGITATGKVLPAAATSAAGAAA